MYKLQAYYYGIIKSNSNDDNSSLHYIIDLCSFLHQDSSLSPYVRGLFYGLIGKCGVVLTPKKNNILTVVEEEETCNRNTVLTKKKCYAIQVPAPSGLWETVEMNIESSSQQRIGMEGDEIYIHIEFRRFELFLVSPAR